MQTPLDNLLYLIEHLLNITSQTQQSIKFGPLHYKHFGQHDKQPTCTFRISA
ncbi:unnamed protein product [Paramecium primaurelia]|uniref:Uncharacterized protein n=1 Tax=Paramecium primaurelia TaxID=5886 RepID=A0A8S1KBJ2_PARPR|nr:unnamed protein product [Paramecium primaurelia]